MKHEGDRWREYRVARKTTVALFMKIDGSRLRVKQQKNRARTYYCNFNQGVFLTQHVLDALVRKGVLKPHTRPHAGKADAARVQAESDRIGRVRWRPAPAPSAR